MDNQLRIGQQVKAKRTVYYCMGQCIDDRIKRGEIVTIDRIDSNGHLGFEEHADRYGPWNPEDFRLVK